MTSSIYRFLRIVIKVKVLMYGFLKNIFISLTDLYDTYIIRLSNMIYYYFCFTFCVECVNYM